MFSATPLSPGDYSIGDETIAVKVYKPNGSAQQTKSSKFPLIKFKHLKYDPTEVSYVVKGIIPKTGLGTVWGPPKCGKSFWLMDILLHVAFNWVYRGHRITPGAIVYCAFEGAQGFHKRADAFRKHHGIPDDDDAPFYLSPLRMDLIKDHPALVESIREQLDDGEEPIAIALDTLNRSLVGSESRDEDMAAYLSAADAIRETFGCVVVIVHHCGIEASRPRGHTSLTGAVDAQLKVVRDENQNVIVTLEYMKDGEEGETFVSRLERVVVGIDRDGDEETSLVVVPGDPAVAAVQARRKSSKAADPIRDALTEAFDAAEKIRPRGDMAEVFGIKLKDALAQFERRYVVTPKAGDTQEQIRDSKRKAFDRAIKRLPASEFGMGVVNEQQWIWKKS
jgi:hypothetical protein